MLKKKCEDNVHTISFNSFLAGVLLTRSEISNFEFFEILGIFEKNYAITSEDEENDIYLPICLSNKSISLIKKYDDIIVVDGKKTTVRNYLYGITTPEVREFFNIPHNKSFARILCKRLFSIQ